METISVYAILALLSAVPTAEVQVRLLRGEELKGQLVAASAEKITVATATGEQTIPAPEVLAVDFPKSLPETEQVRLWVELLDGSSVKGAGIAWAAGKATIELLGGDKLTDVPARAIRAVRFNDPTEGELTPAWNEILAAKRGGDVLVLRKIGTREVEGKIVTTLTLDELEGTVLQIGTTSISFNFDGDKVEVKREKLEGIIFFQPVKRELPAASLRMQDVAGSEWRLRTIEIKADNLRGITPAGVSLTMPLARIQRLDFSAGNVAMLTQLPMEVSEASGALIPKGLSNAAADWFGPFAGKRPGPSTKSTTITSTSTLSLTGKSLVTYRVPEGFRSFRASVLLASKSNSGGDVEVVILGDGKPLAKYPLLAAGERKPLQIEVEIAGVRRLSLQTNPLSGQGLGALVDFQDARFTK